MSKRDGNFGIYVMNIDGSSVGLSVFKSNYTQQRIKLIAWYEPTYENPRGFSIRLLFAKFSA